MSPEIHFSETRRASRTCTEVAFFSVIITVNDYGPERPKASTISDNRPDSREKYFLQCRFRGSNSTYFIYTYMYTTDREDALEDEEGGIVAGVFATSIYRDYSGARSSVDRDGNKFDKSICSTATTRSSLSAAMFAARVCKCLYAYGTCCATSPDSWGWSKYLRLIISSRLINARRYHGVITAASRGTRHFARRSLESRSIISPHQELKPRSLSIQELYTHQLSDSIYARSVDGDHRRGLISRRFRKLSSSNLRCYSYPIYVYLLEYRLMIMK